MRKETVLSVNTKRFRGQKSLKVEGCSQRNSQKYPGKCILRTGFQCMDKTFLIYTYISNYISFYMIYLIYQTNDK